MKTDNKQFIVLDGVGNPLARRGDEASPFIFYSLTRALEFVEAELSDTEIVNNNTISIVELNYLETKSRE